MEKSLWNLVQSCYCLPLKVNISNWHNGSRVSNRYFVNKLWEYTAVWNFFVRALSEKEQILALVVEKYSLRMHKDPIGTNLVQKSIIVCLKGNLVLRLIQIFEFDGDVHFFVVDP